MKKTDPWLLALVGLSLAQLAGAGWFYTLLPEIIPVHWNIMGQVDGWAGKPWFFLLAAAPLLMSGLAFVVPVLDPKKENYEKHWTTYRLIMMLLVTFFSGILWMTLGITLGWWNPDVAMVIPGAIGVLFMVLGNYMPRIRHNYTLGIRLPWTLASETVWTKTHRLGGVLFFLLGTLTLGAIFLPPVWRFGILLVGILALLALLSAYSWYQLKKEKNG